MKGLEIASRINEAYSSVISVLLAILTMVFFYLYAKGIMKHASSPESTYRFNPLKAFAINFIVWFLMTFFILANDLRDAIPFIAELFLLLFLAGPFLLLFGFDKVQQESGN